MFTSLEIRLIQICKSKKPDIKELYAAVGCFLELDEEGIDAEDVAAFLIDIVNKIHERRETVGQIYFSVIQSLLNENPQNFGLIRDKSDSWQNLVAILVSRIRLTEVHKLANLGYVSERPQGNNNP
jgi:hypothetical protein